MRVELTVIDPHWGAHEDVVIDADDATPMGDVIEQLVRVMATPGATGAGAAAAGGGDVISLASRRGPGSSTALSHTLYVDGRPLDPEVPFAESGLKTGSLVSLDDPVGSVLDEPEGVVEIRVVSGLGAGSVHRLPFGLATIGSDLGCVVVLDDTRVPPTAVEIDIAVDGSVRVRAAEGAREVLAETVPHLEEPWRWTVSRSRTARSGSTGRSAVSSPSAGCSSSSRRYAPPTRPSRTAPTPAGSTTTDRRGCSRPTARPSSSCRRCPRSTTAAACLGSSC